ncbi:MAG TPA: YceI family protein [Daejeonella sp.]|nr:YceI family protein [Daejeonella sp.]
MKKVFSFLVLALLSTSLFAQTTWNVDPAHARLGFIINHMGISDVDGIFKKFDVTATAGKADFSDAVFQLSADVNSIDTEIEMRDNHLRNADFFDVEKYPKLTFKSTSIKPVSKNKYKVTGDLTLKGVTKPVTMDLWYRGTIENAQSKTTNSGFQLTGVLKRSDFNLGTQFPSAMLSDEVQIKADGEFIKK